MPFHYDDSLSGAPAAPALAADITVPIARVQASGDPTADNARVRATLQALGNPVCGVPVDIVAAWRALTDEQRLTLIEQGCRFCGSIEPKCYCQPRYENWRDD